MILFDEGKIRLDDPVQKYLPDFIGGAKDRVTIRMLLEHRSGLPAGRDLWRSAHTPDEARDQVIDTPLICDPGQLLRVFRPRRRHARLRRRGGVGRAARPVPRRERVSRRSVWTTRSSRRRIRSARRIAPTEVSPPRGYPLQGEVHDENAFALGGVAGHAGLFSTANDLAIFAQMMLNGGTYNGTRIVSDSTIALFTQARRRARARSVGTPAAARAAAVTISSEDAYGHTGFTGTSLWIDPDRDMFVILLTNRVHAARAKRPAKVISDVRADLADAAALAVTDYADGPMAMPAKFRADKAIDWNRPRAPSAASR